MASLTILVFDYYELIVLLEFHKLAKSAVIVGAVIFGCLSLASFAALVYEDIIARHKVGLMSRRRKIRRGEAKEYREQYETEALERLDWLSREEISYVADCLRKNEQSFLAYYHSGPIANLIAKGLVDTPGGQYNRDYYPYTICDFAWKALLERKDEFIEKDDEFRRQDEQNRRRR
ncbi:MAG TPA: super-infection exclusion protein B [Magnetovibrio sp.]